MNLTMFERLALQQILPHESNFVTLRIITNLNSQLSPSDKEIKKYKLVIVPTSPTTSQITWDTKYDLRKIEEVIEIGETAYDIISEILKKLNNEKKLTLAHFVLYEKFVETKKGK